MASHEQYLQYILDQLSLLQDITYRKMMGEYLIYYQDKLIGGIYDDCFLLKPVPILLSFIKKPLYKKPYPHAKKMIWLKELDDKEFLAVLIRDMYESLPVKKKRK